MFIIPFVFPVSIAICARIICQHLPLISAPNLRREYTARRLPGSLCLPQPALANFIVNSQPHYNMTDKANKTRAKADSSRLLLFMCCGQ